MKDVFGKTLEVGQTVAACMQFGRASYDLVPAQIVGFTPQMVRISRTLVGWNKEPYEVSNVISPHKLAVVS